MTRRPAKAPDPATEPPPDAATALALLARGADTVHVAAGETAALRVAAAAAALDPDATIIHVPAWDCLPYDRASPSAPCMAARLAAIRRIAAAPAPRIVVVSPEAALQRVPAPAEPLFLAAGDPIDPAALAAELRRLGYHDDDIAEAPGTLASRGEVLDLVPADAATGLRVEHDNARIAALRRFDPLTQRSTADEPGPVVIPPASELVLPPGADLARRPGLEHALPDFLPALDTVFTLLPDAAITLAPGAREGCDERLGELADCFHSRLAAPAGDLPPPLEPGRLHLDAAEWAALRERRAVPLDAAARPLPAFGDDDAPVEHAAVFVAARLAEGQRVLLAGTDLAPLLRALADEGVETTPEPVANGAAFLRARKRGPALAILPAPLAGGFTRDAAVLVTAADAGAAEPTPDALPAIAGDGVDAAATLAGSGLRPGDAVVHWEHGVGILDGVAPVDTGAGRLDCLELRYARDMKLLVPFGEIDQLWRYGGDADGVSLDHLNTDGWARRRTETAEAIAAAAHELAGVARARDGIAAPVLAPDRRFPRFVAGFGYAPTPDQDRAIAAVLADLASGHPMDRLVCGDVGFGKTEVALRAAAIAAFAGHQVAVLAPTTVLARQHAETFRRRFRGTGIEIAVFSRLTTPAEQREAAASLADGTIRIAIGTEALASPRIRFRDLALLVVDEEQRFGVAQKKKLRRLGQGAHVLTLTATPIPRTLQATLVGLQSLSVLATPPARRQPIRTEAMPLDETVLREALAREHRRHGQSFVVTPRVEDLPALRARLERLLPELRIAEAHGALPPAEMDDAMLRFANGDADVLLATNIIETGLDVPRANTMVVTGADRFGLAQLHQLRGRVGRGRGRGSIFLMTDPARPPGPVARKRLATLEHLDRVGSGFAIAARDLDLRGAGDLMGDTQAGHVRLIGLELYQHLLRGALAAARGKSPPAHHPVALTLGIDAHIPETYVPDAAIRVDLLTRLAAAGRGGKPLHALDAIAAEIADRFGPPPEPVELLLAEARLRARCRALRITALEVGPTAAAASFAGDPPEPPEGTELKKRRLLLHRASPDPAHALRTAQHLVALLVRARRAAAG